MVWEEAHMINISGRFIHNVLNWIDSYYLYLLRMLISLVEKIELNEMVIDYRSILWDCCNREIMTKTCFGLLAYFFWSCGLCTWYRYPLKTHALFYLVVQATVLCLKCGPNCPMLPERPLKARKMKFSTIFHKTGQLVPYFFDSNCNGGLDPIVHPAGEGEKCSFTDISM